MSQKPKNRSLQAKSQARMAAVQLAYRAAMRNQAIEPATLMAEYAAFREGDAAIKGEAPSKALLLHLLQGIAEHHAALEKLAEEQLKDDWTAARTSPILLAILKYAILELDTNRGLNEVVVIDEYTTIASKLLEHDEVGFVHATLKKLTTAIRK